MKKNVVWWIGVKNEKYSEKYGGWDWLDISRRTWEYWCERHGVEFVSFEKPIEEDLTKFRINWQKAIFVFDELDRRKIDYDQIWLIDGMTMIKWDAPNVFDMTNHKFTAWRDTDNLGWIYNSIVGYKNFFNGYEFNKQKYFSSGAIIFNEKHKKIFKSFKELYYDNVDKFVELQDKIVRKGTEQTPLNYWLQINNVEINLDLPFSYKLSHIHRKEMFNHNWQLNDDKTPFFIKYGHLWSFTGLPKYQRTEIMKQIWNLVKSNYSKELPVDSILDEVQHKDVAKYTTSKILKKDVLEYFGDSFKDKNLLELGCCQGDTTRVYSYLFDKVYAVERDDDNLEKAKVKCIARSNVEFLKRDVYVDDFNYPMVDVVVIDAGHTYNHVKSDITRVVSYYNKPIIIIDDYGQVDGEIKRAVNESIEELNLKVEKYIGEKKGFVTANGKVFVDREGVILSVN